MIGLGVGIDYSLFVVTRHFEQRRDGMDTMESIARSTATSGGSVVFAGTTVIIALLSLAVVRIPLVTTLGYTAALVVLVAVTAAITLLPALLAIAGDRIDRLALPHKAKSGRQPHGWSAGAVRRGAPDPQRGRRARHPGPARAGRRSISTSASRTTGRCRPTPSRGRRTTRCPPGSGSARTRRCSIGASTCRQAGARPKKPDTCRSRRRRSPRRPGQPPARRSGARRARPSSRLSRRPSKSSRSESRPRSRSPLVEDDIVEGGGHDRHADHRAVRPGDRDARARAARRHDPARRRRTRT